MEGVRGETALRMCKAEFVVQRSGLIVRCGKPCGGSPKLRGGEEAVERHSIDTEKNECVRITPSEARVTL